MKAAIGFVCGVIGLIFGFAMFVFGILFGFQLGQFDRKKKEG